MVKPPSPNVRTSAFCPWFKRHKAVILICFLPVFRPQPPALIFGTAENLHMILTHLQSNRYIQTCEFYFRSVFLPTRGRWLFARQGGSVRLGGLRWGPEIHGMGQATEVALEQRDTDLCLGLAGTLEVSLFAHFRSATPPTVCLAPTNSSTLLVD